MIDDENIHRRVTEYHQSNTRKVTEMLLRDYDLRNLETVFNPEVAEVYRRVLPRYASLCETNQSRALDEGERALLAVSYASLYVSFGDDGTVAVGAA